MSLTYAFGDIHGCVDKLRSLVAACRQHAGERAMRFVMLGDYIDRGPDSAAVVDFLMRLQREFDDHFVALMGNHEAWALEFADRAKPSPGWLQNGGAATLASYGVGNVGELPPEHLDWMHSLPCCFDDGLRFFVHAGIDPERPLDDQDEYDLLWMRMPFLADGRDYGRLIVHGHTPLDDGVPELYPNRLNLDTGAVFGGPLTAAVFDDEQVEPLSFLQAR
jgi:serine/threonine protein phosphatase 1